ncbi:hypothetical protein B0H13DRAFT_1924904 [Mycena leptocephala]|nr:hypothetical protein B0H13DRAFT_1924904 [Mycena leptocephala]
MNVNQDVNSLVNTTASLRLRFYCCDSCCTPRFFYRPDDPPEDVLSASSKRKFYVVKKGAPDSEGIYSHWDLARVHVDGVSSADHKSCATADLAREMWADHCHEHHPHSSNRQLPAPTAPPAPGRPPAPSAPLTPPRARPPAPLALLTLPRARPPTPSALLTPPRATSSAQLPSASRSAALTRRRAPPPAYEIAATPPTPTKAAAEAELRTTGGDSLLVGRSLQEVEDDDEVTPGDAQRFYRVFGSPRVLNSHECAVAELVETQAAGLLDVYSAHEMDARRVFFWVDLSFFSLANFPLELGSGKIQVQYNNSGVELKNQELGSRARMGALKEDLMRRDLLGLGIQSDTGRGRVGVQASVLAEKYWSEDGKDEREGEEKWERTSNAPDLPKRCPSPGPRPRCDPKGFPSQRHSPNRRPKVGRQ